MIFAYGSPYVKISQKLSHPCGPTLVIQCREVILSLPAEVEELREI
jgi:hypothetical protein